MDIIAIIIAKNAKSQVGRGNPLMCGMTQYAEKGNPMAKLPIKSGFAAPSADVMAAIDGEAKAAALRQACFEYDAKRRDLELKFETALSQLRELYLAEVLNIQSGTA